MALVLLNAGRMRLLLTLAIAALPGLLVPACGGRVSEDPAVTNPTVTPTSTSPTTTATPTGTTTTNPPPTATGTTTPTSTPPGEPPSEPPPAPPPYAPATSPFEALKRGVVGRWFGEATAPWGSWALWLDLHADGRYATRCVGACVGFYYGDDKDTPLKQYVLLDLTAALEGEGDIDISWDGASTTRGELHRVVLSPDRNVLTFEFFPTWLDGKIGPVKYRLKRVE